MPRMIELIRQSAVPANIMRSAARGALSVPVPEMLEILVYLSSHPVFGEQARLTLAGWDETSARVVVADPATSLDVLVYMSSPQNLRPNLLSALLENPSVPANSIADLLAQLPQPQIATALSSSRVRKSSQALRALAANRHLTEQESGEIQRLLEEGDSVDEQDHLIDVDVSGYLRDHAEEVKEAESQPFQLLGSTSEEEAEVASVAVSTEAASVSAAVRRMNQAPPPERESVVQKVARLSVGERVLLAMKGNKDERFILIRDGARVVSSAVLESPKLTDSEVETFAGMKNVSESVLRGITMKRKFMKNYNVVRILTMNPRCPIDVSIPLLSHLLTTDLKNLSMNKNVADTVRKMAFKLSRERLRNQ
jgi:hypothetical protein